MSAHGPSARSEKARERPRARRRRSRAGCYAPSRRRAGNTSKSAAAPGFWAPALTRSQPRWRALFRRDGHYSGGCTRIDPTWTGRSCSLPLRWPGSRRVRPTPRSPSARSRRAAACRGCLWRGLRLARRPRGRRWRSWSWGRSLVVAFATGRQSTLVPSSYLAYPRWESGPLHGIMRHLPAGYLPLSIGFSVVVLIMLAAYGVVLAAVRTLSLRTIVLCVVALHAIVLLSPPLQLTDVFNYLGYARLGGAPRPQPVHPRDRRRAPRPGLPLHDLAQPAEPVRAAVHAPSPIPGAAAVPVAYWVVKVATVLASLALRLRSSGSARASSAATRASRWCSWRSTRSTSCTPWRLPQRLLHARPDDRRRSRCCWRAAIAGPARC